MTTKQIVLKWFVIIYLVALLPPLPYLIGCLVIYAIFFKNFLLFLNITVPTPSFKVLTGLMKRNYMQHKIAKEAEK